MIAEESIEEVKQRASILEVIGEVVTLRRRGTSYVGLCPFHSEKSPSFHVRDDQGYFHCFGCGQSGNVFKFLMETKGISFPDAVRELADRFGIRLKEVGRVLPRNESRDDKNVFYSLNTLAARYFLSQRERAPDVVQNYLFTTRQLNLQSARDFAIGFAPSHWNQLTQYLLSQKVSEEILLKSGLSKRSEKGELYDTFRSRLIFPIFIDGTKIAGFGGRIIPALLDPQKSSEPPKYLNSPETPVYQKSKILYGLPHALKEIKERNNVYIVEGYLDVISLAQSGVKNVVATCGTALTELHVKRLSTLVSRVTLLFDGDSAGRTAAAKVFPLFLNAKIDVQVLFLPPEEDPDTIAHKFTSQTLQFLESIHPRTLFDCYVEYLVEQKGAHEISSLGPAQRGAIGEELAKLFAAITNPIERGLYIERAALSLRIDPALFTTLLKRESSKLSADTSHASSVEIVEEAASLTNEETAIAPLTSLPKLDQEIVRICIAARETFPQKILHHSDLCEVLTPSAFSFIEEIQRIQEEYPQNDETQRAAFRSLLTTYGPTWIAHWKAAHQMRHDKSVNVQTTFDECCRTLIRQKLTRVVKDLEQEAAISNAEDEKLAIANNIITVRRRMQMLGLSSKDA